MIWRCRKKEIIYLSVRCHHQNDSCIKMGSSKTKSHFNVSLIVRGEVARQCPQTTIFPKRKESWSGIEPKSFCLQAWSLAARPNRFTKKKRKKLSGSLVVLGHTSDQLTGGPRSSQGPDKAHGVLVSSSSTQGPTGWPRHADSFKRASIDWLPVAVAWNARLGCFKRRVARKAHVTHQSLFPASLVSEPVWPSGKALGW